MRRALALVVAGLVLVGCGSGSSDGISPPPPPPPPPPANTVSVSSNQFSPSQLSVATGTTVTWNFQGGNHNVTFEDNQGNADNHTSGTHTRTFNNTGTVRYRCTNHSSDFTSGMIGSVVVSQ